MKGRIIFVGVHYKPGMTALDSSTKSGQIIDEVIKGLEGYECLKTNLFAYHFLPEKDAWKIARGWIAREHPKAEDTVVLLGGLVNLNFPHDIPSRKVIVHHPASRHINTEEKTKNYIKDLINQILQHDGSISANMASSSPKDSGIAP